MLPNGSALSSFPTIRTDYLAEGRLYFAAASIDLAINHAPSKNCLFGPTPVSCDHLSCRWFPAGKTDPDLCNTAVVLPGKAPENIRSLPLLWSVGFSCPPRPQAAPPST